jgi:hypothetical protein
LLIAAAALTGQSPLVLLLHANDLLFCASVRSLADIVAKVENRATRVKRKSDLQAVRSGYDPDSRADMGDICRAVGSYNFLEEIPGFAASRTRSATECLQATLKVAKFK